MVDVCDVIEYKGSKYRVNAFLKKANHSSIFDSIYHWGFCPKNEATHVSGAGICGCIVSIKGIKVVGNMDDKWSAETIQSDKLYARRLGDERVKV